MKVIVLAVCFLFLGLCGAGYADTVADRFVDTFSGKNDSCPLMTHTEIVKQFNDVEIPFLGSPDIQTGIAYNCSARSLTTDNSVEIINRIIY